MSSPRSSPPLEERPLSAAGSTASPSRKRTHDDMAAVQGGQNVPVVLPSDPPSESLDGFDEISSPALPKSPRESQNTSAEDRTDDDQMDPEQPLEDFDWRSLEERYHDAMAEKGNHENELFSEFQRLMDFFRIWAQTTSNHEVDRSFVRLRTRMDRVQHSEDELDQKREHYMRVVQAFERALQLLNT